MHVYSFSLQILFSPNITKLHFRQLNINSIRFRLFLWSKSFKMQIKYYWMVTFPQFVCFWNIAYFRLMCLLVRQFAKIVNRSFSAICQPAILPPICRSIFWAMMLCNQYLATGWLNFQNCQTSSKINNFMQITNWNVYFLNAALWSIWVSENCAILHKQQKPH